MELKIQLKDKIKKELEEKYGKCNVCIISTEGYDLTTNPRGRNSKKDRSNWADSVVQQLYDNVNRRNIVKQDPRARSSGEYNFSYIKFAIDRKRKLYGIVGGKSSFHCMYPGDVWFYEFDGKSKKELKKYMDDNKLEWYKNEILILKNEDALDSKEAYDNEKEMKKLFNLFN